MNGFETAMTEWCKQIFLSAMKSRSLSKSHNGEDSWLGTGVYYGEHRLLCRLLGDFLRPVNKWCPT